MENNLNLKDKLNKVQYELKSPKNQFNKFGNYKYRSCEDILESLKPLLNENKLVLIISDSIEVLGNRYYVKATVRLMNTENDEYIETSAYAREEDSKKGMDSSQITGSSSSYARKYALNGMFMIDDTRDSDETNNSTKKEIGTDEILKMIKKLPKEKQDKICVAYSVTELTELNNQQLQEIYNKLKK